MKFSFKHLFALVFSLVLMGIGIYMGLRLPQMPKVGAFPGGAELVQTLPGYLQFTTGALGIVGFMLGAVLGLHIGDSIMEAGNSLAGMKPADKIAAMGGVLLGGLVASFFTLIIFRIEMHVFFQIALSMLISVVFVYLGYVTTTSMKTELFNVFSRGEQAAPKEEIKELPTKDCKILDTNVIIDGRIHDICRAGFIEGTMYVPGFVLEELQHIADSADSLKRARGRRGLDILNNMQKEHTLVVRSWDKHLEKSAHYDEVDTRLVKLAKVLDGAIVTNDFNLNKVAVLQGVQVLNINELANALKPVVLPGEIMRVGIVKEGKELTQGIAYLDDGTMIVVEDGRKYLNETMNVMVTSVLQTAAGKMIFARIKPDSEMEQEYDNGGNGNGSGYPRRGTSKKVR